MGWDETLGWIPRKNVGVDQKVPLMKGDPKQSYIAKQQTDKRQHGNVGWNEMRTCGMGWDGMGWDGMGWDCVGYPPENIYVDNKHAPHERRTITQQNNQQRRSTCCSVPSFVFKLLSVILHIVGYRTPKNARYMTI